MDLEEYLEYLVLANLLLPKDMESMSVNWHDSDSHLSRLRRRAENKSRINKTAMTVVMKSSLLKRKLNRKKCQ